MTIGAFALDRRLDLARRLLAGPMSLVEIAGELGFADRATSRACSAAAPA